MRNLIAAMLILAACGMAAAQDIGPVVMTSGNWELRKSQDKFTDKVSCVITQKGNPFVQISRNRLIFANIPKNSIKSYRYRFDNETPEPEATPSVVMNSIGLVYIDGAAFERFLKSKRFRMQVITTDFEQRVDDLQVDGLERILEERTAQCQ